MREASSLMTDEEVHPEVYECGRKALMEDGMSLPGGASQQ